MPRPDFETDFDMLYVLLVYSQQTRPLSIYDNLANPRNNVYTDLPQ